MFVGAGSARARFEENRENRENRDSPQKTGTVPIFLSWHIIDHKGDYYSGLRQVTEAQCWQPWILYMLHAIERTARATRERILAIRDALGESIERVRIDLPKI